MLKAVIFDMDGTIIDSEPLHIKLENELFRSLGIKMSKEEHEKYIGTTSYFMWEKIKNKYNLKVEIEDLVKRDRDEYYNFIIDHPENISEMDGASAFIEDLYNKNFKLCLASSSPLNSIELVLKILKADKLFKSVITGDQVQRSKPYPDIFLKSAESLEVSPKECIVIEDSQNGVTAAKRAGMMCIGIINKNSGNQDLSSADIIIDSFKDLNLRKFFNSL